MNNTPLFVLFILMLLSACQLKKNPIATIQSPESKVEVSFGLTERGKPYYRASFEKNLVMDTSLLGFELANLSLDQGFSLVDITQSFFDETWEQPWGEQRLVRNHYRALKAYLENDEGYLLTIHFRVFDNGFAFRYEFPEQERLEAFEVMDELTEFNLANDLSAWWIPAYKGNRYEYEFTNSKVSSLDKVHTPLTMEDGMVVSIHEAALYDYPSMVLSGTSSSKLKCDLVPYSKANPVKAYLKAPFKTPWRTVQLGVEAGDLMTNYMILNLNDPNKLGDVSWVQPGKYVGVWWEMFINLGTWNQGPKHAANTSNVKRYIDFAAANGFKGVLVEGWNYGWDGPWMNGGTKFDFTKPYPDYDVKYLSQYAEDRGVYIIGHHETGADIDNYDEQLEEAYGFLAEHGMRTVKTGYVENGDTLANGLYHHGQAFVQHFQRVIETAAKYKTMIVAHEPIHATGKRRTYPNMVSREGAKGQEYNAMGGTSLNHATVLPFTRGLAGPFDYTPGVFAINVKSTGFTVPTTIARELALYLVIYAPMQMANDLPENYESHPLLEFIREVPTDWETTIVLSGEIGQHVAVARQERGIDRWFVGAITNESPRVVPIPFDFLPKGVTYEATIYRNADDASYPDNPEAYAIDHMEVTNETTLDFDLIGAGGVAISLVKKK